MIPLNQEQVQYLSAHLPTPEPIPTPPSEDYQNYYGVRKMATPALNDPAASFPRPRSVAPLMNREQLVRQFMILGDLLNAGTLLVDVRRTDYEGGTIRGSLNLPAQSFPLNISTLFRLCAGDGLAVISRVVFYCGSSTGRGPRCAGWFLDHIEEQRQKSPMATLPQVFVLDGGIKGWALAGAPYTHFMDVYVPSYWEQFDENRQRPKRGSIRDNDDEAGRTSPAKRSREDGTETTFQQQVIQGQAQFPQQEQILQTGEPNHDQNMQMTF